MKKLLPLILRIIGIISIAIGCFLEIIAQNAGLAGIAPALAGIPLLVLPFLISIALKSWKRLGVFIILAVSCALPINYIVPTEGYLIFLLLAYAYFRFMKNAYLKQILLFIVIPCIVISIFIKNEYSNLDKAERMMRELDKVAWECIQRQEKYGTSLEMLPQICDLEVRFENISKGACKNIAKIEPWQMNQDDNIDADKKSRELDADRKNFLKYVNGSGFLAHTKVIRITANGETLDKNVCTRNNEIIFKAVPFFIYVPYTPVQRDDVEYTTLNGKVMTRAEWVDRVWDDIGNNRTQKQRDEHNKKTLENLNNKTDNTSEVFTIELD